MINPSIHLNKIFRTQIEKCLGCSFSNLTMTTIKKFLTKKNTYIMELIKIYENIGKDTKPVYIVLSSIVYTLIDNYVYIDYLSCQSKKLCDISSNPIFEERSFNLLLGIGIPELLLNLVSCHGFTKKSNSTVTLNCQSRLIKNYLSKGFFVIKQGSKQLSLIPNDLRLRTNLVDQLETDYFMV